MAALTEATQAKQIEKALEVLAILTSSPKMTQKKACDQVGITPTTYRKWIAQSHEAITAFRETIREVERVELAQILIAKEAITEKLIADGLAKYTDPMARLAIVVYLDRRLDQLAERHRSVDVDEISNILSGPKMEKGENRFGATTDLVIQADGDGGVNIKAKTPVIIDGVSRSTTEQQVPSLLTQLYQDPLSAVLDRPALPSGSPEDSKPT
jgi:hypothetical protein